MIDHDSEAIRKTTEVFAWMPGPIPEPPASGDCWRCFTIGPLCPSGLCGPCVAWVRCETGDDPKVKLPSDRFDSPYSARMRSEAVWWGRFG